MKIDSSDNRIVQDALQNEERDRQRQVDELQVKKLKYDLAFLIVTITKLLPCRDSLEELLKEIESGLFKAFFTTLCAYLIYFIDRLNQSQALPVFDKELKEILMHYNEDVLQCEITIEDAENVGTDRKTYIESLLNGKAEYDLPREMGVYRVIVSHFDSIHRKIKLQSNQVKELTQLNPHLLNKGSGLILNRLEQWPPVDEVRKFIGEQAEKFTLHEPKKFRQETLRLHKEEKREQLRQNNVGEYEREAGELIKNAQGKQWFFNQGNIRLLSAQEKEICGKSHEEITKILEAISNSYQHRYPFHLLSNLLGCKTSQKATFPNTVTELKKLIEKYDRDHVETKDVRTKDPQTKNFCLF